MDSTLSQLGKFVKNVSASCWYMVPELIPSLSVEVTHSVSYKDEIFNRLKEIKERKEAMEKEKAAILGEDIVDAEVVDEAEEIE